MPRIPDEFTVTVHTPAAALDENTCWCVVAMGKQHDVPRESETYDVSVIEGHSVVAFRKRLPVSDGRLAARAAAGNL